MPMVTRPNTENMKRENLLLEKEIAILEIIIFMLDLFVA